MTDRIENTRQRGNAAHLLGMMVQGQSSYIEDMEADGQRQLVSSQQLPKDGPWDDLTALGFVRGADRDDLFCAATLPDGWTKEGSDHAMWSYIVDPRGIRMVAIFYKAAFYDRSAFMRLENVGYKASTDVVYGDEPVALPPLWDVFTDAEKDAFREDLGVYLEDAARHPSIYGDRADRARDALALAS